MLLLLGISSLAALVDARRLGCLDCQKPAFPGQEAYTRDTYNEPTERRRCRHSRYDNELGLWVRCTEVDGHESILSLLQVAAYWYSVPPVFWRLYLKRVTLVCDTCASGPDRLLGARSWYGRLIKPLACVIDAAGADWTAFTKYPRAHLPNCPKRACGGTLNYATAEELSAIRDDRGITWGPLSIVNEFLINRV